MREEIARAHSKMGSSPDIGQNGARRYPYCKPPVKTGQLGWLSKFQKQLGLT